ncbi:2,5-diamino-6-(ribosylamino)-4(3H)-pyrimidinone 5'-phosphate reductase [Ceratobasidium sp. 370]|nr:2,5-diamino-6-(ribosylamino)-4(3H)-pyrimidinone 5'-phosphate reductase [Ceratobasidium sp. 370]
MSSSSQPPEFLKSVISARDAAPRSSEQQKRARVTLTYAQSLDAKIAGAGGSQLTISGNESMTMTHWLVRHPTGRRPDVSLTAIAHYRLRTMHQGIMVGIQTVLNDDPQLNVRRLPQRDTPYPQPRPIILDSYLRTPPTCKLLKNFAARTGLAPFIIYGLPLFDMEESKELRRRKKALEEAGAILITGFEVDGRLDLAGALRLLKMRGINSVMIEGGQRVISSMLTDRHTDGSVLVDTLIVTVAPTLIGFDGMGVIQQGKKLSDLLAKAGEKLTVIDFHATWCGPCHAIAPKYEALSKEYTNVNFTKCDVDAVPSIAKEYSVSYLSSAMPTFVFIKNSKKVDQVRGADPRALEATLRSHATASAFSGKGQTLGSSSGAPAAPAANERRPFLNLDPQIQLFLALVGGYLILTWWPYLVFSK